MNLYNVPDYRLDPPAAHADDCTCDECHAFHREDDLTGWAYTCDKCRDEIDDDISRGVRCQHGRATTDLPCPDCKRIGKVA